MSKKKIVILITSLIIFLGIASLATALFLPSALATHTTSASATDSTRISGSIVIDWNKELLHIVQTAGTQPATIHPTRSFAILHAAMYDSVVSITRETPPYRFSVSAPVGARPDVAAATAGHDTLLALYPKLKTELDKLLANELTMIQDGAGKQEGIQVGQVVAARWIAARADDGSAAPPSPFTPGNQPGNYLPTPPKFAPPVFPNWKNVTPFVLNSVAQFRPEPPPALTSQAYAQAINEVKNLGQNSSSTRTPEQTVIAKFWAGPIWNTWNEIAENSAIAHHTNLATTARLFAALDLSFADSTIAFYEAKYYYQLWRPVTAIRKADTDNNPATVSVPNWTPLTMTALDPSYPGAHSAVSATGATVLSTFFGNQDQVHVTSDVLPGVVRTFTSYNDVATEAGLSRIYAGQHTRLDHNAGLKLGQDVAHFILPHFAGR